MPPQARVSSSASTVTAVASPPSPTDPPNSAGVSRPSSPASPSSFQSRSGGRPSRSASSTTGRTRWSVNARTLRRKSSWTSSRSWLTRAPSLAFDRPVGRKYPTSQESGSTARTGGGRGESCRRGPRADPRRRRGGVQPPRVPRGVDERRGGQGRPAQADALPLRADQAGPARRGLRGGARREPDERPHDRRRGALDARGRAGAHRRARRLHLRAPGPAHDLLRGGVRAARRSSPRRSSRVGGRSRTSCSRRWRPTCAPPGGRCR